MWLKSMKRKSLRMCSCTNPPFMYHFCQERYKPFYIPSIGNSTNFTYLQKHFFAGSVRDIFKGPFKYLNDSFSYPFLYFRSKNTLPFYIPLTWKRYPFRTEPPRIVYYRVYPSSLLSTPPPPPNLTGVLQVIIQKWLIIIVLCMCRVLCAMENSSKTCCLGKEIRNQFTPMKKRKGITKCFYSVCLWTEVLMSRRFCRCFQNLIKVIKHH